MPIRILAKKQKQAGFACFFGSLQVYLIGKLFSETSTGLSFFAQSSSSLLFPSPSPLCTSHFSLSTFFGSRALSHEPKTTLQRLLPPTMGYSTLHVRYDRQILHSHALRPSTMMSHPITSCMRDQPIAIHPLQHGVKTSIHSETMPTSPFFYPLDCI